MTVGASLWEASAEISAELRELSCLQIYSRLAVPSGLVGCPCCITKQSYSSVKLG